MSFGLGTHWNEVCQIISARISERLRIVQRNVPRYPEKGKNLVHPMSRVFHHQLHWIDEELLWREQIELGYKHRVYEGLLHVRLLDSHVLVYIECRLGSPVSHFCVHTGAVLGESPVYGIPD